MLVARKNGRTRGRHSENAYVLPVCASGGIATTRPWLAGCERLCGQRSGDLPFPWYEQSSWQPNGGLQDCGGGRYHAPGVTAIGGKPHFALLCVTHREPRENAFLMHGGGNGFGPCGDRAWPVFEFVPRLDLASGHASSLRHAALLRGRWRWLAAASVRRASLLARDAFLRGQTLRLEC